MLHLGYGIHLDLQEVLHEDPLIGTLLEIHPGLVILAQQVVDLLIVDLDEATADEVVLRCIVLGDGYDLTERTGNDALGLLGVISTHHGMRLAAARLSICEDSSIVSVQHIVN